MWNNKSFFDEEESVESVMHRQVDKVTMGVIHHRLDSIAEICSSPCNQYPFIPRITNHAHRTWYAEAAPSKGAKKHWGPFYGANPITRGFI